MELTLVRHGETDLNKNNRMQGSHGPDLPLNETGQREIEEAARLLSFTPSVIYASPTRRTRETAEILNRKFRVPIEYVPDLMERDFGSLSGLLKSEVDPALLQADLEERYDYRPFGGECVDDVRERIMKFISMLPLSTDESVLIVTHRGIIRLFYDLFPGQGEGDPILPGSIHNFTCKEKPARPKTAG